MRLPKHLLLLALSLPVAVFAKANTGKNEGVVQGQVTDAVTKKPIAGVVVSMTTSKTGGEKEVVTDSDGNFKLSKLPGGDVSLVFEKKGYKVHKRDLVNTKDGMVYKVSLDMVPLDDQADDGFEHPLLRMSGGAGQ
ncbi:MAG TPA: carboxypeptidase-like regulatory domain-containing protein [Chitinophagaceae bacterium]|nr:carboxypeptidase-like regulatory domain-containing protein [Chitinophagaceae bacterium]